MIVVCLIALVVSSSGAWPVTVMPSSMRPDAQPQVGARGGVGVDDDVALVTVWNPVSCARTLIGARHEPHEGKRAALVGDGFLIAADRPCVLVSVTVAPGRMAPDESRTLPRISPTPCAKPGRAEPTSRAASRRPLRMSA